MKRQNTQRKSLKSAFRVIQLVYSLDTSKQSPLASPRTWPGFHSFENHRDRTTVSEMVGSLQTIDKFYTPLPHQLYKYLQEQTKHGKDPQLTRRKP